MLNCVFWRHIPPKIEFKSRVDMGSDSNRYTVQRYHPWAVARLSTREKNRNGANLKLRHTLRAGGVTGRLQRRSLRLPTRSKSAQTGHLCTTAQAGADPGIFVCRSKFPGLKVGRRSWLANMALQSRTWNKKSFFLNRQYHSFSACVDAGYDIKESVTDISRDIQQTMQ